MAAKKIRRPANRKDDDKIGALNRSARATADYFTAREVKKYGPYVVENEVQYNKGDMSRASRMANDAARRINKGTGRSFFRRGGGGGFFSGKPIEN